MAHGDYNCCAVCNSKQEYVGLNDTFKSDICPDCRETTGMATVTQLMQKINSFSNPDELMAWIKEVGLEECYYQNDVDDLIAFKLTGQKPEKFKSASEFLQALGVEL